MANTNFKIKTLFIENESKKLDLRAGFISLDYYEDVTSPSVILDLVLVDGDGVLAELPLVGGESVSLEIEFTYETQEVISFTTEDNTQLVVVNSSISPSQSSNFYILKLMSLEILANETTRVVKRYDSNISSVVNTLLTENDLIGTKKELSIESTKNSYSFIGCFRRPFDIINWLCPKSVPTVNSKTKSDSSQSAGFLFYETRKGYTYASIDKTFQNDTFVELNQSTTPISISNPLYYRTFSQISTTENNDVLKSLRLGTYAHNSIFLNMWEMNYQVLVTKLSDKYNEGSLKPSNSSAQSFTLNGLQDYPSRLMYRLLDAGALENADKPGEPVDQSQLAKYQADAYMRYNLLFTSTTRISLPLNASLCAGDVVKLNIAKGQKGSPTSKVDENISNQRYIISKLRHSIQGDNNFTSLELVSDSYSVTSE